MNTTTRTPFFLWKHLNKARWVVLAVVFLMLVLLPYLHIYQNFVAAHAYDLLAPSEKSIYDTIEAITEPFVSDPAKDLNAIKGTTWSGTLFGLQLSDPLAVLGQIAAALGVYWPFVITALIPIGLTVVLGRFYCGWLCPATLLYELTDKTAAYLRHLGLPVGLGEHRFDKRFKYAILVLGLLLSGWLGTVVLSTIYPPALVGREIFYGIAYSSLGVGSVLFLFTLMFDVLVARRGFCRYLCPGGALYSLLGRYRPLRIQRIVENCNDCARCNIECQFGLDPRRDGFGQECNNCTACIAVCPTEALTFEIRLTDRPNQGQGHLSPSYLKAQVAAEEDKRS